MLLIGLAFYILIYSGLETYGQYIQLLAFALFVLEAIRCTISAPKRNDFYKFNTAFLVFSFGIPLISITSALFRENYDSVWYSLIMIPYLFSISICLKFHGIERIITIFFYSISYALISVLLFDSASLLTALAVSSTDTGLFRFSPFGNHPNLIGHIFGIYACVCFGLAVSTKHAKLRLIAFAFGVLALVFVLAASSRGGLLACVFAIGYASTRYIGGIKNINPRVFAGIFITFFLMFVFDFDRILNFLNGMLELDSDYRGTGSGMTGRTAGWPVVFSMVMSDLSSVFFGNGFRTWDPWVMGFDIDNSYVNLLYEVGLFSTLFIIFGVMHAFFTCRKMNRSQISVACNAILVFMLAEGMVARYLVSIGNPSSILFLFVLFYAWGFNFRMKN